MYVMHIKDSYQNKSCFSFCCTLCLYICDILILILVPDDGDSVKYLPLHQAYQQPSDQVC